MNRPPTAPKLLTPARIANLRKADPEAIETLQSYVDLRLQNIVKERAQLLRLRRFFEFSELDPSEHPTHWTPDRNSANSVPKKGVAT